MVSPKFVKELAEDLCKQIIQFYDIPKKYENP